MNSSTLLSRKSEDSSVEIFEYPARNEKILPKFDFFLPNYHSVLPWRFLLFSISISDFLREECNALLLIMPCLGLPLPSSEMNLALPAKFPLPSRLFPIIIATTERKVTDNIIYQLIDKVVSLVRI